MNGRMVQEDTPEGRIAGAVVTLNALMRDHFPERGTGVPDYADYRAWLKPHLDRELLVRSLDELHRWKGVDMTYKGMRERELIAEIASMDQKIKERL